MTGERARNGDRASVTNFVRHLLALLLFFALIELIAAVVMRSRDLFWGGTVLLSLAVVCVFALRRFPVNAEQAASWVGYGLLAGAILTAPATRFVQLTLVLLPPLAVAAVLSDLKGRSLRIFMAIAFASEIAIAALTLWLPPGDTRVPVAMQHFLSVSSLAAALYLTLQLLLTFCTRMRDAVDSRDLFLSQVSHELKTPLTSLKLQLQVLGKDTEGLPERLPFKLEQMDRQVTRLNNLVDRLLDMSQLRAGRMELVYEPMDLHALVKEILERMSMHFAHARCQVELRASGPIWGEWDRLRIEQVITNLLSNAAKYGAGAPIDVSLSSEGDAVVLVVKDHGIGIAPEALPRLFERFQRASSVRHYAGIGLGLFIARAIVRAHRGEVSVESRTGEGSTFTVSIPRFPAGVRAAIALTSEDVLS